MKIHCQLTLGIDSLGGQESTEETGGEKEKELHLQCRQRKAEKSR